MRVLTKEEADLLSAFFRIDDLSPQELSDWILRADALVERGCFTRHVEFDGGRTNYHYNTTPLGHLALKVATLTRTVL